MMMMIIIDTEQATLIELKNESFNLSKMNVHSIQQNEGQLPQWRDGYYKIPQQGKERRTERWFLFT
jgi:hypothetical protein